LQARAQFAQAEFAEAAGSYRKLLELEPRNLRAVESYAMALEAADRESAPGKFRNWVSSVEGEKPRNAEAEQVGLSLLAGDAAAAHKYEAELQLSSDGWAPDYIGELAWFYYLSGDSTRASQLLETAAQQRPGNLRLWVRRAWVAIENRRYSDALRTTGNDDERNDREKAMAQAVAFWLAKESEEALRGYDRAVALQPEWGDPRWVKALYSPLVAQSVEEMKAERERQKKQRLAEKH
jgi:tetratricopeptide (TPR) repeat protein